MKKILPILFILSNPRLPPAVIDSRYRPRAAARMWTCHAVAAQRGGGSPKKFAVYLLTSLLGWFLVYIRKISLV